MERLGSERYIVKTFTLREKCPDTELFLVRIYLYSAWIWRFTPLHIQQEYKKIRTRNNSVFGHFSHSVSMLQKPTRQLQYVLSWEIFHGKHCVETSWCKLISIYTLHNKITYNSLFTQKIPMMNYRHFLYHQTY